jgi:flagellar basal-body rod protein FlgC
MNLFHSMNISTTGLTVNRLQMNVISTNLANANTTRTESGEPYRRQLLHLRTKAVEDFQSVLDGQIRDKNKDIFYGVNVDSIDKDMTPFRKVYNPGHPHADKQGFVSMPNVNTMLEMANLVIAKRSYDANATVMKTAKAMALKALEIGK